MTRITITRLVTLGPLLLILSIASLLGVNRYMDQREQLLAGLRVQALTAARPIAVLGELSTAGANYANLETDDARALYDADPQLLAFEIDGRSTSGEAFGIVFDRKRKKVIRTHFPQGMEQGLEEKLAKAEQRLAELSATDEARPKILALRDRFRGEIERIHADQTALNEFRSRIDFSGHGLADNGLYRVQVPLSNDIGTLSLMFDASAGVQDLRSAILRVTLITALALAVSAAAMTGLAHRVVRPLKSLVEATAAISRGNLDYHVPGLERSDEIGQMAAALEVFKQNAVARGRLEAQQKAAELRAAAEKRAFANEFEAAVGGVIETVSSASTELEAAAHTLTKTAETTQQLSTVAATASEEASANVQSVASATEEMTASISEIGRQVQEATRIANEAVTQARGTDARINELSKSANRIGDIVKLITSVAEQTNLLALNATIEAARAGDAGKGFAVVAQEVKALAAQTATATEEISSQITGMQTATQDSVKAINQISGTIWRISEISSAIAAAVQKQGAATEEISRNVGAAAKGTTQVAMNITDVNRGASETGSACTQVLSSAQSLSEESNRLKLEVQKFLATVRVT
jgi:methyl-accepting chemotaxis protein